MYLNNVKNIIIFFGFLAGRWSGSERFSLDSDVLFSGTSQQRLSRLSADRDSALGADINDNR